MDKEMLAYNAKLQQKKSALRKILKAKGVLKREGNNAFDKYSYFSEAQYKQLFTELFSEAGLELKFTELDYTAYDGTDKQPNGRMVKLCFTLIDTETGFDEDTVITGEALDKGDKAGYKAYTGALKYYLANTFMVATGDDPEVESPEGKTAAAKPRKATAKQVEILTRFYKGDKMDALLQFNGIDKIEDMPMEKASLLIGKITKMGGKKNDGSDQG